MQKLSRLVFLTSDTSSSNSDSAWCPDEPGTDFFGLLSCGRVDVNKDRSVSSKELQEWIMEKTKEHFQEAMKENKNSFHAVDPDGDGELLCPRIVLLSDTVWFKSYRTPLTSACRLRNVEWVQSQVSVQQRFWWKRDLWQNKEEGRSETGWGKYV